MGFTNSTTHTGSNNKPNGDNNDDNNGDNNDTKSSPIDTEFATELLENMIGDSNADPTVIKELMDQIMEKNKENASNAPNTENKTTTITNTDIKECDIADPVMNEKLVTEDYIKAHDETPEFFIPTKMLYIPCTIRDQYITAFIDTGAQISVMNLETAVKCGLYERINTQNASKIIGVGDQSHQAVGTLYHVEMILGQYIVPCNFTVLRKGTNIIIGLNFMRAHKVLLDVGQNILKIGSQEIPFLNPNDIADESAPNESTQDENTDN